MMTDTVSHAARMNENHYIKRIDQCETPDELKYIFQKIIKNFGFDSYVMASNTSLWTNLPKLILSDTLPENWKKQYAEQGYYQDDAVLHYSMLVDRPFYWHETYAFANSVGNRQVRDEAEARGLADGLLFPLHNTTVGRHLISLASTQRMSGPIVAQGILYLVASHFSAAFYKILNASVDPASMNARNQQVDFAT